MAESPPRTVIVGGCGHVGLPLGVSLARAGVPTVLVDIDREAVATVRRGELPFLEDGGEEHLAEALERGLEASSDPAAAKDADVLVFVTGTPVDEHLNPRIADVMEVIESYLGYMKPGSLVIMRSTVFPGTMEHLHQRLSALDRGLLLAFCPERVSQGHALDEIRDLPQIISAFDEPSFEAAYDLLARICPSIIRLTPLEAELTKLMANSWRYLEFAIANQFYLIAESQGVDFYRIFQALRHDYPRAAGYKSPGFAAGPCLFKDTMQLASYHKNQFYLGHAAMLVNEGLADYAVEALERKLDGLWGRTVGLLGMSFKANNDDIRDSLSYRVKKGLEFRGAEVIYHDPYVAGSTALEELLERAEGLVLCTPHREYRELSPAQPIVDVWGSYTGAAIEILPGRTG